MASRARVVAGPDSRQFWEGVAEGRLMIQRCADCGVLRHPPTLRCRECGSFATDYIEASGKGTVFSFGVPRHPPSSQNPLGTIFAVVSLDEGVRMFSNVVGSDPSEVHIGMPVTISFERYESNDVLPLFRAAPQES
jgi:uncharacterized OB-fold protein